MYVFDRLWKEYNCGVTPDNIGKCHIVGPFNYYTDSYGSVIIQYCTKSKEWIFLKILKVLYDTEMMYGMFELV